MLHPPVQNQFPYKSRDLPGCVTMTSSEIKVVFLGPRFTFSHEAALKMFPRAQYFYEIAPKEIFKKVNSGEMDYGILPIENSATGIIPEFYPLLLDQDYQVMRKDVPVHVAKELYLPIYHHVLAKTQIPLGEIQTLYTHRQPYLQCIDWIQDNLPNVRVDFQDSTAAAAEKLAQDSKGACVGGNLLAKQEKLVTVRDNIQDYTKNVTRFFAVSATHKRIPQNSNKTTFAIIIPDRVGALVKALQFVSSEEINLMTIKTLPVRAAHVFTEDFKDWFLIDVAAGRESPAYLEMEKAIASNKDSFLSYKFLGSYISHQLPKGNAERLKPRPPKDALKFYTELIEGGEREDVEFKGSLRFDYKTRSINKELSKAVAKTLCGFMNSNGGYLFVGVADNGEALGIDEDINVLSNKTVDGFLSASYQVISDLIGKEFSQYVQTEVIQYKGKRICCVKAGRSSRPAWLSDQGTPTFFIRVGNSTRPLNAKEANEYVLGRFKSQ